jgi:hypothetical protein
MVRPLLLGGRASPGGPDRAGVVARTTAWTRSRRPSLRSRLDRWVLTVASARNRRLASSAFDSPVASSRSTSSSRAVSDESCGGGCWPLAGSVRARRSSSRRVTAGASSAPPPATTRTASTSWPGRTSLSRKPLAPTRIAASTSSSRSAVVRMRTRTPEPPATSRRVASTPSRTGMRASIRTTSGRSRRAAWTAWSPSAASPTTWMSGSASRIIRNPARTSAWPSASSTRTLTVAPPGSREGRVGASSSVIGSCSSPTGRCPRRPGSRPGRPGRRPRPRQRRRRARGVAGSRASGAGTSSARRAAPSWPAGARRG